MTLQNSINSLFSNTDAFGNLAISQLSTRIQLQFPYLINTDIVNTSLTGSGTVTHSAPFAVCSTSATINSTARIFSKNNLHYRPGQGGLSMFTAIFTEGVAGSVQEIGLGDSADGFFFGFNGDTFSINRRSNTADNYIAQSTWNKDKMDGTGPSKLTLIPTNGNVYKIQYQWLGFGAINFYIESQETGLFVLVHQIKYANSNITTSILNPSLPLTARVINTTNNTNIVLKTGSMSAFVEGQIVDAGVINSINNQKTGITTETNILTIRNKSVFGSITNKKFVNPVFLSISNTSNSDAIFKVYLNTSLGGSPSFTDISANTSCVDFDIAGTTVTGGRLLLTVYLNGNTQENINLSEFLFYLNNSDTLTISATSSGAAIIASTGLTWSEQF